MVTGITKYHFASTKWFQAIQIHLRSSKPPKKNNLQSFCWKPPRKHDEYWFGKDVRNSLETPCNTNINSISATTTHNSFYYQILRLKVIPNQNKWTPFQKLLPRKRNTSRHGYCCHTLPGSPQWCHQTCNDTCYRTMVCWWRYYYMCREKHWYVCWNSWRLT